MALIQVYPQSYTKNYFRVLLRLSRGIGFEKTIHLLGLLTCTIIRGQLFYSLVGDKKCLFIDQILGNQMYLSLEDKGLSQELFVYGIHEPFLTLLLSREIKKDDVIIEVGANIGYYVLMECSLLGDKGKVIAFEPDYRSLKILKKNIKMNGNGEKVDVTHVAIGPKRKKGQLIKNESFNLSKIDTSIAASQQENADQYNIDIVPLDDLVSQEPKIDIIRMDIEGYEFEAINGMSKTLTKFHPRLLVFELHPVQDIKLMQAFFEKLSNLDYEIKWAIPRHSIDAMLEVPLPLLKEALEVMQGHAVLATINRQKVSQETAPIKAFAEKFCSSDQTFHVFFQYSK